MLALIRAEYEEDNPEQRHDICELLVELLQVKQC